VLDVFEAVRLLIAEEDERLSRLLGEASTSELKALWGYSGDLQRWATGMLKARGESPPVRLEFSVDAEEADRD